MSYERLILNLGLQRNFSNELISYFHSQIIPPSLPLPTTILQRGPFDPIAKKYLEFMMLIGVEFEALSSKEHLKSTITNSLKEIEQLFYFEVQLAKV